MYVCVCACVCVCVSEGYIYIYIYIYVCVCVCVCVSVCVSVCVRVHTHIHSGPEYFSRYSDSLWAGWSGDRVLLGPRFSALVQNVLEPSQPPTDWVPWLFPGSKTAGAWR